MKINNLIIIKLILNNIKNINIIFYIMSLIIESELLKNENENKKIETINHIELDKLRKNIEDLDIIHHIEIGKIFKKNNIELTENNNGIFINLNLLDIKIINEIKDYLKYVKTQENDILKIEIQKEKIENKYFNN
jgi:hypothetical protein